MLTQIKTKIIQSWSAKEIPYHLVIAGMGDKSFRGFNVMYAFQDAEWHTLEYDTSDLDMEAEVSTMILQGNANISSKCLTFGSVIFCRRLPI